MEHLFPSLVDRTIVLCYSHNPQDQAFARGPFHPALGPVPSSASFVVPLRVSLIHGHLGSLEFLSNNNRLLLARPPTDWQNPLDDERRLKIARLVDAHHHFASSLDKSLSSDLEWIVNHHVYYRGFERLERSVPMREQATWWIAKGPYPGWLSGFWSSHYHEVAFAFALWCQLNDYLDAWKPVFAATTALTGPETVSKDQALSILHTDDSASLSVESPARSEPPFEPPRSSFSSRDASPTTTYAPSISEATTRIFGSILTSISHASTSTTSFSSSSTQLSRRTRVGEDKSKES